MQRLTTVIPVYNGERYLAETLQSVAAQTRRPDRLVVLDNCSTDGTRQVVENFREMPCEWHQNEKNLGLFGNCNRALEFATSTDYLHILHADDVLKPTFYETLVKMECGGPGPALTYCGCDFIDENGRPATAPKAIPPGQIKVPTQTFIIERSELRPFYFPTVLLKTARQPSPCSFRLDMPQLADLVFWAEWAANCKQVLSTPSILCSYRLHASNDTSRNISSLQAWVLDEWKAMQLGTSLLKEDGFAAWMRRLRLKCIFAARSHVKIGIVRTSNPDFASQIRRSTLQITGLIPWLAGKLAVGLRDLLLYTSQKK